MTKIPKIVLAEEAEKQERLKSPKKKRAKKAKDDDTPVKPGEVITVAADIHNEPGKGPKK